MIPRSWLARCLAMTAALSMTMAQENADNCPADLVSFEIITGEFIYQIINEHEWDYYLLFSSLLSGFAYTAPQDMIYGRSGILNLNDCIETCRGNSSCKSLNFETGRCVLFSSTADENKSKNSEETQKWIVQNLF